jgi:hypothetical protein
MADTKTLAQLRADARERADMTNSQFISDATFNGWINDGIKELWDKLTAAVEDYQMSDLSFTLTSGNTRAVPSDFYKLRAIDDLSDPDNPKTVRKFMFGERNDYSTNRFSLPFDQFSVVVYRLVGSLIYFMPPEQAARPYRLWYTPIATPLVNDTDTFDGINGWYEYPVLIAARKALAKEESDTTEINRQIKEQVDRIDALKGSRDQNTPERVTRVRNRREYSRYPDGIHEV